MGFTLVSRSLAAEGGRVARADEIGLPGKSRCGLIMRFERFKKFCQKGLIIGDFNGNVSVVVVCRSVG